MMERRLNLGGSGVHVSPICLGTMRLSVAGGTAEAARLLGEARGLGITTFHCSSEYGTYGLFRDAWSAADLGAGCSIMAKVAAPHYGEDRFSPPAFRAKIEAYLSDLCLPRLDVVQWLLRYDLKQEQARVEIMRDAASEIAEVVAALKAEGKIGAMIGFPYSPMVAQELIAARYCDGLALYINPLEHELDGFIAPCGAAGKSVVAIRPYAAGRVFCETQSTAHDALRYVFDHPEVTSAVVSASSRKHLEALASFAASPLVA